LVLWSQVKGCVKLLKEQPAARSEGLLNALRWVTNTSHRENSGMEWNTGPSLSSSIQVSTREDHSVTEPFRYSLSSHKHLSCVCDYSVHTLFCKSSSFGVFTLSLIFQVVVYSAASFLKLSVESYLYITHIHTTISFISPTFLVVFLPSDVV
jgi:hypothetical protein